MCKQKIKFSNIYWNKIICLLPSTLPRNYSDLPNSNVFFIFCPMEQFKILKNVPISIHPFYVNICIDVCSRSNLQADV